MNQDEGCFTLELLAAELQGPTPLRSLHSLSPTLLLQLLDLPPAIIDAAEGEAYGPGLGHRISFSGCGKALVFELLDGHMEGNPVPLWLMALGQRGSSREVGTDSPSVLIASTCVDLGSDVRRAAVANVPARLCPFRRCCFRMTSVAGAGCSLSLECYLRLYAGAQQPSGTLELPLLESSAAAPEMPPTMAVGVQAPSPSWATAGHHSGLAMEAAARDEDEASTRAASPQHAAATLPGRVAAASPKRMTPARGVYFAEEIHLGPSRYGGEGVGASPAAPASPTTATTSPIAHVEGSSVRHTPVPVRDAAGQMDTEDASQEFSSPRIQVAESLPLVSELVRELLQIRNIS